MKTPLTLEQHLKAAEILRLMKHYECKLTFPVCRSIPKASSLSKKLYKLYKLLGEISCELEKLYYRDTTDVERDSGGPFPHWGDFEGDKLP
jgi:hypothetical protein